MIGFMFRRMRWMLLGSAARAVVRRGVGHRVDRAVDQAADELEQRLPAPVVRAAERLPGDVVRTGAAATVGLRAARRGGVVAARGGSLAARGGVRGGSLAARGGVRGGSAAARFARAGLRHRADLAARIDGAVADTRGEVDRSIRASERELRADYLRWAEGERAATDALLDRRPAADGPLPAVPPAVPSGRRRARPELPAAPVGRVQRTYRRPRKAWDRRSERR